MKIKYLSILIILSLLCVCASSAATQGEWNGFKVPLGQQQIKNVI